MNESTKNTLHKIWLRIAKRKSTTDADRMVSPIIWFIGTGRCSGAFVKAFNNATSQQITKLVNALIKYDRCDYKIIIEKAKAIFGEA